VWQIWDYGWDGLENENEFVYAVYIPEIKVMKSGWNITISSP
jgi:hypothetical protein